MAFTKYSDFLNVSKDTLINYCSVRGMSTSGNTKVELVAKAFTAMDMKFEIVLSSEEQQQKVDEIYETMLTTHGIEDPKLVPQQEKIDDMTKWQCAFFTILHIRKNTSNRINKRLIYTLNKRLINLSM